MRLARMAARASRAIQKVVSAMPSRDGEGANVNRVIGQPKLDMIDPFLMLDEFCVKPPGGFPNHPHRGFETVTYMTEGTFTHRDNKGNKGTIHPGDLQWMTAGRGIIHSEMPGTPGENRGLQLWVNLPAKYKMMEPRYQDRKAAEIPSGQLDGVFFKVIAGTSNGVSSSLDLKTPVLFLDVTIQEKGKTFSTEVPKNYDGFVYVYQGQGVFGKDKTPGAPKQCLVLSSGSSSSSDNDSDELNVENTSNEPLRFFVIAGQPIREPIARYGPFVMNTQQEIEQAFMDYRMGRFN
eukprot:GEZU01029745.1.p1 GENE.GEZU01029745.1~~GEZU01029745.1.p1  ORF type:complete len:292 (-),score=81.93 GEZU01029745.1:138-1013(-)